VSLYHRNKAIYPNSIALNVYDLTKMVHFYKSVLGFRLIEKTETYASFSTNGKAIILELYKVDTLKNNIALYHVAFLLDSKQALANLFKHILTSGYSITGGADHTVSEALYLEDPEGNGIELYIDTTPDAWETIKEHPERLQNLPFPYESYLMLAKPFLGIDPNTIIGHIHLHVNDLKASVSFLKAYLGYEVIVNLPTAYFMSSQRYHHHIAVNTWRRPTTFKPSLLGLRYIGLHVTDKPTKEALISRLSPIVTKKDSKLYFKNPDGYPFVL